MIKKSLITLALVAMFSATGQAQRDAQERRGPGPGHDPVARLTEELQLNETQATQLTQVMSQARTQHEALKTSERAEHCAIQAETEVQIASILTDEQYTRFEELRIERVARRGEGRGRGKGRHRPPLDCSGQIPNSNAEG